MATPLGHSLAGCATYGFLATEKVGVRRGVLFLSVFMAVAPDLDFLPGILVGRPALFHQGSSHSLGAALVVSLVIACLAYKRGLAFAGSFGICFIAYASHIAIDYLGGPDSRPPIGVPVFWPVSDAHFISPVPLFSGVSHAGTTSASIREWIAGILAFHNVVAIGLETALIGPIVLASTVWRRRRSQR